MSRIRANQITNQAADGAPTVQHGLIIAGVSTFTGSVSIGGTLTYEDVTNIDSVGIITAGSGIDCNGTLEVSSTSNFDGDVQIADTILHLGDTNTKIRFPAADTITAETAGSERLRITSTGSVGIGTNNPDVGNTAYPVVQVHGTSTNAYFKLTNTTTGVGSGDGVELSLSGSDAYLTNRESANIIFRTGGSNERLRITSTGQFVVGTNPTVNSGNIAHIEAPTSFNSGETIVNIEGDNAAAGARLLLQNNNTGGSAHNEILGTDAGGQSTSSIRFYNTDQSNNYGEIAFGTRNASGTPPVDRMRISKDGYVTKPNHPAFKCSIATQSSPNTGVVSENNGFTLNATSGRDAFNNGSHFSEATGRFTAPVTGLYFFHFSVMRYSGNGSGSMDLRIKKNTALIWARSYKASYSTNYESINLTTITNMTAGHFVEFILGANMSVYDDDSYMLGYLIG